MRIRGIISISLLIAASGVVAANPGAPPGTQWPIPERIDVSKVPAPKPVRRQTDITVGMWYFPIAETNVLANAPWRTPLLYDSTPGAPEVNGIRLADIADPRVIDWHVYWMTKYGVNLMVWDWYPRRVAEDKLDVEWDMNRVLECGFLGKRKLGGPPTSSNRFAGAIDFVVMVTNHMPVASPELPEYLTKHFFSQPNYFKIDGKPWVIFWSPGDLIKETGSAEKAKEFLETIRESAKKAGFPGAYVTACVGYTGEPSPKKIKEAKDCAFDGACAYNYAFARGGKEAPLNGPDGNSYKYRFMDFEKDVRPNHTRIYNILADNFGTDYIAATCPMQDWRGGRKGGAVMCGASPEQFKLMLQEAKEVIQKRNLRPILTVEAWNELGEGAYCEPNLGYGYGWLEAIAEVALPSK
ncbi:MAG: glycoside hydrolase family 99-like domain-containing protein [Armatimonadota bacterium]|nr:glycoside hydrolase family 99-like domain-containing protein [Armatimonadota bacterium]